MANDVARLSIRASLYEMLEVAAERRCVPVSSFVSVVLAEYLRERGELNEVTVTHVEATPVAPAPVPEEVRQQVLADWGEDED